jgi:hypothetical protein
MGACFPAYFNPTDVPGTYVTTLELCDKADQKVGYHNLDPQLRLYYCPEIGFI